MKIFCDMDGVLADFNKGAYAVHNKPYSPDAEWKGPQQPWDLERMWGITQEEFWRPTNNYDFWFNLDKTPEADEIVEMAMDMVGEKNVAILTSPSLDASCVPAKRAWVDKHYPSLAKTMIFSWGKGMIGGPQRILIDDRDRNIDDWEAAGGYGVLVPRPWNKAYERSSIVLPVIKVELAIALQQEASNDHFVA